jgi:flagellar biosynthesis/type III secretory pathway protein FliH
VPADLAAGPYREALELANQATLTRLQLDAYLKVCDEIQQVTEIADARLAEGLARGLAKGKALGKVEGIAEGRAEGKAEGRAEGNAEGLANILLVLVKARGFSLSADIEARILDTKDASTLERWILRLSTASIAPTAASIEELLG